MQVYAHRGASAHAPENTLKAIRLAVDLGADGIEIDVFQHGEEFILTHDRWLARTTSASGNLYDFEFDTLRQLDAGLGEQIPTLAEAIEVVAGRCVINVEAKGVDDAAQLVNYVDIACQQNDHPQDMILYSSFDHPLLAQIKALRPTARIGALTASKPLDYARFAEELGAECVNVDINFLDQAFISDAKTRGLKVLVYTVDYPDDILRLRDWGVDGIFANAPDRAMSLLGGGMH